jgi:hypothetical protein
MTSGSRMGGDDQCRIRSRTIRRRRRRRPAPWPDLAQEMLRRPSRGAGTVFQYSDASTYVAMRMLGAYVGDVRDWLVPRLFEPLGIANPQ